MPEIFVRAQQSRIWNVLEDIVLLCNALSNATIASEDSLLEKEMATHSSTLAWRIPWTQEPGGLPSTGSHRVGHDWSDLAAAAAVYSVILSLNYLIGMFKYF